MTILDWAYMGAHFLWIFGLALILAAFSYHSWLNQDRHRPLSAIFTERSWRVAFNAGLTLMPLAITVMPRSERWFVRAIALIISFAFASLGVRAWWQGDRQSASAQPQDRAHRSQQDPGIERK